MAVVFRFSYSIHGDGDNKRRKQQQRKYRRKRPSKPPHMKLLNARQRFLWKKLNIHFMHTHTHKKQAHELLE